MTGNGTAIVGMGMITAVGLNVAQSAASVRAGTDRFTETSIYDKRFQPFVMSILPDDVLPPLSPELEKVVGLTSRQIRMLRLAAPALQETVEGVSGLKSIPLYLGGAEPLTDRPAPVAELFLKHLSIQAEVEFDLAASRVFLDGRAAGLVALKEAMEALATGKAESVLVGGVDTFLDLYLLGTLDMENRILGPGIMDGFIPGEGAAFLLLTKQNRAATLGKPALGSLSPVSMGFEDGHLYSEQPYRGDGLAGAFTGFFGAGNVTEPIRELYSAMNGENHWAKELGVAFIRNSAAFDPSYGMHHPADCIGDTGAASGIILTIIAATGIYRGYRRSPALVSCSSDRGVCGAVAVTETLRK
jgi:3-oxoacyl-[acyl-carrier-protein] synthase-1